MESKSWQYSQLKTVATGSIYKAPCNDFKITDDLRVKSPLFSAFYPATVSPPNSGNTCPLM